MNKFHTEVTKTMVFGYFARQATPLECQQIETWLKTREGLEMYFLYLDEWERKHPQFQTNFDLAHEKFTSFLENNKKQIEFIPSAPVHETFRTVALDKSSSTSKSRYYKVVIAAASVALLTCLWFSKELWFYQTWNSKNQQVLSIRLEDGSTIQLGANSSLKKNRFGFGWGTRKVWLNGEAEFKVVHLPATRKFVVSTPDNTTVEVLGTEFVINSRPIQTKVLLRSGSIRLSNPVTKQPLTLKPGELVTVFPESQIERNHTGTSSNETNWKLKQFEFKETPLHEVAHQLHQVYGIELVIPQQSVLNRTVSGAFEAESAEDLLEAIALMMKLEVEETPDAYLLSQPD